MIFFLFRKQGAQLTKAGVRSLPLWELLSPCQRCYYLGGRCCKGVSDSAYNYVGAVVKKTLLLWLTLHI